MKHLLLVLTIALFSCTKTATVNTPPATKTRTCKAIPITLAQFNTYQVYSYQTCTDYPSTKYIRTYQTNKGTVTGTVLNFPGGIDCPIYCDSQIPSNLKLYKQ
jgi:hypothetical protein